MNKITRMRKAVWDRNLDYTNKKKMDLSKISQHNSRKNEPAQNGETSRVLGYI